jgi:hypothetical protein
MKLYNFFKNAYTSIFIFMRRLCGINFELIFKFLSS